MQARDGTDAEGGRHERLVELEASGGSAADTRDRQRGVGVARMVVGQQACRFLQVGKLGLGRIGEQVGRGLVALHEAGGPDVAGVAVAALFAQQRQCEVDGRRLYALGQVVQGKRFRERIVQGRVVALAVGENHREFECPQAAGGKAPGIEPGRSHAPGMGMQAAGEILEPRFVIGVLPLEVLGPQEQALTPEYLGHPTRMRHAAILWLSIPSCRSWSGRRTGGWRSLPASRLLRQRKLTHVEAGWATYLPPAASSSGSLRSRARPPRAICGPTHFAEARPEESPAIRDASAALLVVIAQAWTPTVMPSSLMFL